MLCGIVAGRGMLFLARRLHWKNPGKGISAYLTATVWLLLFLLGVQVGGNPDIIHSLPTLGAEALLTGACATLGSCAAAWVLWQRIRKEEEKER